LGGRSGSRQIGEDGVDIGKRVVVILEVTKYAIETVVPLHIVTRAIQIKKAREKFTLIGRYKKLKTWSSRGKGKNFLKELQPDLGPKLNWQRNSRVLRTRMRTGKPVKDVSHRLKDHQLDPGTSFLRLERNILRNRGWNLDKRTGIWFRP